MSERPDPPVCCTLPEPDLRARHAELERSLARKIVAVLELDDGFALGFEPCPGIVEELARFIDFERRCCAFLDFGLRVERDGGAVWVDLRGSAEAKEFLRPTIAGWAP